MSSFLVCRVCLEINSPEACKNVQQIQTETDVLEMLSYSIPEMNMYLVVDPVICNNCIELLKIIYKFKSQCLQVEETLLNYSEATGGSKVELSEFCKVKGISINNNGYCMSKQFNENAKTLKKEHKKKIENRDIESERCSGCEISSPDPRYHSKTNHSPFFCYHCNKKIDRIIDLRKHMLGHVKQRVCKLCGKGFRDLTVLRRHLLCHTGAKSFSCTLCPKKFQQKYCLDQHLFKHQGRDDIKCTVCHKLFSTKYNAKIHMKTMHRKIEVCDLCGEKFNSKSEFVKHLETNSRKCGRITKTEIEYVKVEPELIDLNNSFPEKLIYDSMENRVVETKLLETELDTSKYSYKSRFDCKGLVKNEYVF